MAERYGMDSRIAWVSAMLRDVKRLVWNARTEEDVEEVVGMLGRIGEELFRIGEELRVSIRLR
jgi:hypothetical protein